MTKPRLTVNVRGRVAEDVPFVTAAWMRASKFALPYSRMGAELPVQEHHIHRHIERLWRDRHVTWLVAAWPEDLNVAYGFLCGEATDAGPVLHWLYVRGQFRRLGVGTALLGEFMRDAQAPGAFITARTQDLDRLLEAATPDTQWRFDPWLLWEGSWRDDARAPGRTGKND